MTKIAFVSGAIQPLPAVNGGAAETLSEYLIEGFCQDNCEVSIYTIYDKKLENLKNKKYHIYSFKYSDIERLMSRIITKIFTILKINKAYFIYNKKVIKEIKKHNYDMIIIENSLDVYRDLYDKYLKFKNTKIIFHLHNKVGMSKRIKYNYNLALKTCDSFIVVSNFLKRYVEDICPLYSNKIKVLYNCVNERFINDYQFENREMLMSKYHLTQNDKVFLYSGRISEEKGVLELIKAFNILCSKHKNIKLLVVGSVHFGKNKKNSYAKLITQTVDSSNIIFTGCIEKEKVYDFYNLADCVVIPSRGDDAFPCVLVEAMAMKKPIIATNSGGIPEALSEDFAIMIKRENLINDLVVAVEKMTFDKDTQKMGEEAYKYYMDNDLFFSSNYYSNFKKVILNEGCNTDE